MEPSETADKLTSGSSTGAGVPAVASARDRERRGGGAVSVWSGERAQRGTPEPRRVPFGVRVHRRVRRYYAQLLICATGFGLIGALVGYRYGPVAYEAEAVLHFQALGPQTLAGGEGLGDTGDAALRSARLANALEAYADALVAETDAGAELSVDRAEAGQGTLRVLAESRDPAGAAALVNERVRAFKNQEPGAAWTAGVEDLKAQRRRASELASELASAERELEQRRLDQGAVSIAGQIATLERRVLERTQKLDELDADLAVFRTGRGMVSRSGPEAERVLDRLATGDAGLAERLEQWRTVRSGLEQAAKFGPGVEAWLLDQGYRDRLRELQGKVQDVLAETRLIDGEPVRRSALQRRRLVVQRERGLAESGLSELRELRSAMRSAETELEQKRRDLASLDTQIAEAMATLPVSARLTDPVRWAAVPRVPVRDGRPWVSVLAGVLAAGLGVLTLLPLALRDRTMRRPDHAVLRDASAPLLAALPALKSVAAGQAPQVGGGTKSLPPPADPAEAAHAAAAIHDLRVLLESNAAPLTHAKTICLTSPAAGSGVTSLTLGLSTALAQAGTRTLLVDLAGLASPRLSAAPADPTLDQALTQSRLLDPDEADLLLVPQEHRLGLPAFFDGEPLVESTLETRLPTLHLLPSLTAQPGDPDRLAGRVLDRLHHEARRAGYDAVLIDAGVVPGRADTLLAAAAADATLLVLAPNTDQRRFNHALAQLRLVHAHVLGSVFNRASPKQATTPPPDANTAAMHRPPAAPLRGSGLFAAAMGLNEAAPFNPTGFTRHAGSGILSVPSTSPTSLSGMPYLGDEPDDPSDDRATLPDPQQAPDVLAPLTDADTDEEDADGGPRVLPRPIQVEADPDVDAFVEAMISRAARRPSQRPGKTTHADDPPPRSTDDKPAAENKPEPSVGEPGRASLSDRLAAAADELSEPFAADPSHAERDAAVPEEDLSDEALERDLQAQAEAERAAEAQASDGSDQAEAQLDAALDDLANEALLLLRSDLAAKQAAPDASHDTPSPAAAPPPDRPA